MKNKPQSKLTSHIIKPGRRQLLREQWQSSGLSKADFCRRKKINYKTFLTYTPGVRQKQPDSSAPALLPIKITPQRSESMDTAKPQVPTALLRVQLKDASLLIPEGFDAATLDRVFNVLMSRNKVSGTSSC